ncbi:hypothetical protein Asi02nite_30910 [Asanoa siamensis]|uniref:Uncharacterized protein n=1 Tax=Asanoa siamensis TaxID=926357 RepID=A0ABQ4CQJ2_9ACTN|nr:hypothetical protein Asi02nite_30910 [Asanoa siamensis]
MSATTIPQMTAEDLMFDLDLHVVPLHPSDVTAPEAAVHPSYHTETCPTRARTCKYGCSYTCRRAAHEQNMCI